MVYCPICGTTNPDDARFCNACGGEIRYDGEAKPQIEYPKTTSQTSRSTEPQRSYQYQPRPSRSRVKDEAEPVYYCCSFCFPIIGVVLFLVWKDERPQTAQTMLVIAIIAFFIDLFLGVALG